MTADAPSRDAEKVAKWQNWDLPNAKRAILATCSISVFGRNSDADHCYGLKAHGFLGCGSVVVWIARLYRGSFRIKVCGVLQGTMLAQSARALAAQSLFNQRCPVQTPAASEQRGGGLGDLAKS